MDLNFIRGQFTEAQLEEAIISLFQEQEYKHVHGETIHRGFDEILLNSNFKIAIVVDMWITGFDVPSLSVMYIGPAEKSDARYGRSF